MEPRHLRYFLTVADTANVTEAARRLFVAQSALSAQIARLETEVGSKLFVRSRRGMRLTEAGTTLRPLAIHILASLDNAQARMDELRGLVSGRLRLGMVQVPPASLDVIGTIAAFRRQYPGVELMVRTGGSLDLTHAVETGELDLALIGLAAPDLQGDFDIRRLCEEPLVAILPASERSRGNRRKISLGKLVEQGPFIHYRRGSGLRCAVEAAFDRAGLKVAAHIELDQIADMIRLAGLGVGMTVVPLSAVPPDDADGGRRAYRAYGLTDGDAVHTVSAVTFGPVAPAASRFLELLEIRDTTI